MGRLILHSHTRGKFSYLSPYIKKSEHVPTFRLPLSLSTPHRLAVTRSSSSRNNVRRSLAMEYLEVTLQKPMGIVLEENDPKIRGVYVKSLSQGGAAAASGKIQAGDHLISVQGASVTGKDLDTVLATVGSAPAEGVQMKFYRGALGDVINPKVFFDIDIGGERAGRVTCRLRKDVVPKTAGTFFVCCL